jgi:hypothetical protein
MDKKIYEMCKITHSKWHPQKELLFNCCSLYDCIVNSHWERKTERERERNTNYTPSLLNLLMFLDLVLPKTRNSKIVKCFTLKWMFAFSFLLVLYPPFTISCWGLFIYLHIHSNMFIDI